MYCLKGVYLSPAQLLLGVSDNISKPKDVRPTISKFRTRRWERHPKLDPTPFTIEFLGCAVCIHASVHQTPNENTMSHARKDAAGCR